MIVRGMVRATALGLAWTSAVAVWSGERPKVVVLGFDGADARLVERYLAAGELPNLARLRAEGSYAPLLPTNPPQTPVSWSSFATGTSPGATEVFDFLRRDPETYLPDFAMVHEGRRTFGLGERNALAAVGLVAGVAFVLALLVALLLPLRPVLRLACALLVALGLGALTYGPARRWLPIEVPDAQNQRKGVTLWEVAARAGRKVQVLRVPATFPAEDVGAGHMLSGLGVPDMRGRIGTPSFYTSNPDFRPGDNEFSLEFVPLRGRRGTIETSVIGPRNKPFYDYAIERSVETARAKLVEDAPPRQRREAIELARRQARDELDARGVDERLDLPLRLEATDTSVRIDLAGRTETLRPGAWSGWFELDFPVNPLVDRLAPLRGLVRFKLLALAPHLELYMSPINFHPDCHPIAFSWPPEYSEELRRRFGLYKTIGWPEDTWSLPSGVGDELLFLEDTEFTLEQHEAMLEGLLRDGGIDLFVQIFYFTDRIGHLFWRFLDEGHPLYDPVEAARWAPRVLEAYKRMDAIVGRARELAGEDALLLVLSDHGFSSFRRGVNYNNWLVANGLMTLKDQPADVATLEKLFETKELMGHVDWSRTKAYALGLGSIYVNLVGRERQGTVLPGPEYEAVRRQIREGLEALVDPVTGQRPVTRVLTREEMYGRFDPDVIPDLRAASSLDYRVSWQTSLGGFGPELIEDNRSPWSGDHCSNDPELVRGILFSSRPLNTASPRMIDIMPTVLAALGLEAPAEVEGRSLL